MSLELDHVALGVGDAVPIARQLTAELGGTVLGGGVPSEAGFRAMQIHLGTPDDHGMTVEVLEPWEPEHNDFLLRFLDRHGDAPHHITFKTKDIIAEHARLVQRGFEPVAVNFSRPEWREMFLHPKVSHGVVIQIAQPGAPSPPLKRVLEDARDGAHSDWYGSGWWGEAADVRANVAARLRRVVLTSPDIEDASRFFSEILGGHQPEAHRLRWANGEVLIEPGTGSGIDRFELTGLERDLVIGGARFVAVE